MEIAHEETIDGARIRIVYDDCPAIDPRKDYDQGATFVCSHRRYTLGDREPTEQEEEAMRRGGFPLLERYLRRTEGAIEFVKLGLIDHSGISMYVGGGAHMCDPGGWDSGTIGFAYVTREQADKLGIPDAMECIRGEVSEYDSYLRGEVYGYIVDVASGDEYEDVDSCWGFIGDMEYCLGEARSAATGAREAKQREWVDAFTEAA